MSDLTVGRIEFGGVVSREDRDRVAKALFDNPGKLAAVHPEPPQQPNTMEAIHVLRCCPNGYVFTTWNTKTGMSVAHCSECGLDGPGVMVTPCPEFPEANGVLQCDVARLLFWKMKKANAIRATTATLTTAEEVATAAAANVVLLNLERIGV